MAAYIWTHPGSVPAVKQHLAAVRMLGDWLVVSQVLPVNPAAAVRGPKHVVTKGGDAGPLAGGGEEAPRVDRWVRSPTALLWLWFSRKSLGARRAVRVALEPLRSKRPRELFDDDEGGLLVSVPLPLKLESDALSATITALRDSIASGAVIGNADAMLEPVLDAMVARLEEVAQLLGATSRRRGTKRDGAAARARRPGEVSAAVAAGMRQDFPRRVGSLRRLVDDATNRGKGKDWADTTQFRATVHASGYGRYLSLGRVARAQVWFGIQFWCWVFLQPPPTPLWLWFTSNSLQRREQTRGALEPLRGKNPSELIDDGAGGLWVPVPLPVDKEYDAVLKEVVERLEGIVQLLDGSDGS